MRQILRRCLDHAGSLSLAALAGGLLYLAFQEVPDWGGASGRIHPMDMTVYTPSTVRRDYWPDGSLRSEVPYRKGVKEGTARFYRPDGTLEWTIQYRRGKLDGKSLHYDPQGRNDSMEVYMWGDLIYPPQA